MAEENVRFKFDLDAKDAVKEASALHDKILDIGDVKNLKGLVEGFTAVSGPIFVAGAALLTVKKLMDWTIEGETLEKYKKNFDELTQQYNIGTERMYNGLEKATRGQVDMDDAVQATNKAIILLGENARRLPEAMDLARRASAKNFGETLSNYESISMAVATLNTRRLRELGLIIDADEAYRKYAKSIGVAAVNLSETGKQAALMDAIIEKGQKRFKDDGAGVQTFTIALKMLSETVKDVYDSFTLFISRNYGEFFRDAALGVRQFIKDLTNSNTAADNVSKLEKEIEKLQLRMFKLQSEQFERPDRKGLSGFIANLTSGEGMDTVVDQNLKKVTDLLKQKREELAKLVGEKPTDTETDVTPDKSSSVDKDKLLINASQFNRQLLQLKESRMKAEQDIETDDVAFAQTQYDLRLNLAQQYDARISEIKAKAAKGDEISASQAAEMIKQIEGEKAAKLEELKQQEQDKFLSVYDNQVKAAKTAAQGIEAAFKQAGANAQRDLENYGKQGQAAFAIVNNASKKFFIGLGEGSKDASQLMREFLFGMLADYAEQKGSVLLAEGIGMGNGIAIAQGGALLALSGLIRSMAGGGGGSSGGGSGGGAAPNASQPQLEKPQIDEEKKKSVTIQVQGNYFETEQSKTRLVEMIRETSDATDYTIKQIGVK